jgi:hypothetical protein
MYGMICAAGRTPRRRVAGSPGRRPHDRLDRRVNRLPLYTTNPADYHRLDDLVTVVAIPRPEPTRP